MSEIKPVVIIKTAEQRIDAFGNFAVTNGEHVTVYTDRNKAMLLATKEEAAELRAAYEALQKENAEHKATISNLSKAYERESNDCLKALEERDYWYDKADSLADKISECFDVPIGEHSNVNCPFAEVNKILDGEYVSKFDKQIEALKAENRDLKIKFDAAIDSVSEQFQICKKLKEENVKLEDELDQYKEYYEEMSEHYRALQFIESELRRENETYTKRILELEEHVTKLSSGSRQHLYQALARRYKEILSLRKENEAQAKRIAELRDRITIMDEAAKYYNETIIGISNKLHAENEALKLKKEFIEYAAQDLENQNEALKAENEELKEDLIFVERWANHHGTKPNVTAQEALSCIQHYPSIAAITKSYEDGVIPNTRNPYFEIEALRKQVDERKEWHMIRDEMRKALEAQKNGYSK